MRFVEMKGSRSGLALSLVVAVYKVDVLFTFPPSFLNKFLRVFVWCIHPCYVALP